MQVCCCVLLKFLGIAVLAMFCVSVGLVSRNRSFIKVASLSCVFVCSMSLVIVVSAMCCVSCGLCVLNIVGNLSLNRDVC